MIENLLKYFDSFMSSNLTNIGSELFELLGFIICIIISDSLYIGGCDVRVIVLGNGNSNQSSNSGCLHFHIELIPLGKVCIQLWVNSRADWAL